MEDQNKSVKIPMKFFYLIIMTLIGTPIGTYYGIGGDEIFSSNKAHSKGSFRSEISKEIGVAPDTIVRVFGSLYKAAIEAEKDKAIYKKLLEFELVYKDIGIKVNKVNGLSYYLHANGNLYKAVQGADGGWWYMNSENKPIRVR